jgi:hypothetical protein
VKNSVSAYAIGEITDNLIKNVKNKPSYLEIFANWKSVVGEYVASVCVPYKIVKVPSNKMLILKAKKGYALEIQHESLKILEAINTFLGEVYFSRVHVIQTDLNDDLTDA